MLMEDLGAKWPTCCNTEQNRLVTYTNTDRCTGTGTATAKETCTATSIAAGRCTQKTHTRRGRTKAHFDFEADALFGGTLVIGGRLGEALQHARGPLRHGCDRASERKQETRRENESTSRSDVETQL
jgi:hypothetical protein